MAYHEFSRRGFLQTSALVPAAASSLPAHPRRYWIETLCKVGGPILEALSKGQLKSTMPVEAHAGSTDRPHYTYLEALGRLLCGMAPWLELRGADLNEQREQAKWADLARRSITAAVDPASPDFMNFNERRQPVVDAAFLALALLRAPRELWQKLDSKTKPQLLQALRSSRVILPGFNNWLLFSATIEAFFAAAGERWDKMRVDYALRQHEEWYLGDGMYGDGPQFHWDYYNSFVIQPMLLAVTDAVGSEEPAWKPLEAAFRERAKRYATIQERLIAPDGSYPTIGRSLAYRCGAFHLLADSALRRALPDAVSPAQVRCALTAVIRRTLEPAATFTEKGWLRIGIAGHQPSIGERYISTGSLYLCSAAFLPLGLPSANPFWAGPDTRWTSQKVWAGEPVPIDHAI